MTILADNTVLSNFAHIRRNELIQRAFIKEVITTEHVFQELEIGVRIGRLPSCNWKWLKRIKLTSPEETQFGHLSAHLGKGEASCLAVAVLRKYKLATDDKDIRQWAKRLKIPHTGTLGILAILVKMDVITLTDGNNCLRQMIDTGYHSPITELDSLIK